LVYGSQNWESIFHAPCVESIIQWDEEWDDEYWDWVGVLEGDGGTEWIRKSDRGGFAKDQIGHKWTKIKYQKNTAMRVKREAREGEVRKEAGDQEY